VANFSEGSKYFSHIIKSEVYRLLYVRDAEASGRAWICGLSLTGIVGSNPAGCVEVSVL